MDTCYRFVGAYFDGGQHSLILDLDIVTCACYSTHTDPAADCVLPADDTV